MRSSTARRPAARPPSPEVEEVLCVHAPGRAVLRVSLRRTLLALVATAIAIVSAGFAFGYVLRGEVQSSVVTFQGER